MGNFACPSGGCLSWLPGWLPLSMVLSHFGCLVAVVLVSFFALFSGMGNFACPSGGCLSWLPGWLPLSMVLSHFGCLVAVVLVSFFALSRRGSPLAKEAGVRKWHQVIVVVVVIASKTGKLLDSMSLEPSSNSGKLPLPFRLHQTTLHPDH